MEGRHIDILDHLHARFLEIGNHLAGILRVEVALEGGGLTGCIDDDFLVVGWQRVELGFVHGHHQR